MKRMVESLILVALQVSSLGWTLARGRVEVTRSAEIHPQTTSPRPLSNPDDSKSAPQCKIENKQLMTIACTYNAAPPRESQSKNEPRIVLSRAMLSFGTKRDSYMLVELTLTNDTANTLPESRTVYLAIDDHADQNILRRVLPKVDLTKLPHGISVTFSERLLVGGFHAGHYVAYLSIPDPDPQLSSDPAHNLLFSSVGVPESATGRNIVAHFTVEH